MKLPKTFYQWGTAVLLIGAVISVLLLRNTPEFSSTQKEPEMSTTPPVMEVPSKTNVTPSFTQQVSELKASIEKNPSNAAHIITLAQLLMDGHQNKEAIAYFEKAALIQPSNDSILLDLAVCYFNEKQYDRSMQATERILRMMKDHPRALYNKGAILATLEKKEEAAAVWKRLVQVAPNSEEAHSVVGHLPALENH
jgi:cytochrome c-type biogenesis protein CcmH/NrfG